MKALGWTVLLLSSVAAAQCPPASGTSVVVFQDSITGPNPIGFAFPFAGGTYTDIHLSDHGICFLSNAGLPAPPLAQPLVFTPVAASIVAHSPVLCPIWSDTIPGAFGVFTINAQATECTITWTDVQSFGFPMHLFTFQMKLTDTGTIEFLYGPGVTNNSTFGGVSAGGVVGVSPGGLVPLPLGVDFTTSPMTTDDTFFEAFTIAETFDMAGGTLVLTPAAGSGWTATYTAGGAGCAFAEEYGNGCDNLALASNAPTLGSNWDLTTTGFNAASSVGFTFFAFGRANPSLPLSTLGFNAPGCELHIPLAGILASLVGVVSASSTTVTVAVPTSPTFAGVQFTAQAVGLTTMNLAGFATSNGLQGTFGN